MTLRFCPECPYSGDIGAYYCPKCNAPFFPNARKGGRLRPRLRENTKLGGGDDA